MLYSVITLFLCIGLSLCFDFGINPTQSKPLECDEIVNRTVRICLVIGKETELMDKGLPADLDTRTLNQSHTLFPGPNGTCYRTETSTMHFDKGYYMGIYNITLLTELDTCDVVIGAYFPSIASYSFHRRKIYMSTTPLPFEHEHKIVHHQYLFGMWPSYHIAVEAINLLMKFKKSNEKHQVDIFIIRHCETVDATNYLNTLYSSFAANADIGDVVDYSIHGEVQKLIDLEASQKTADRIIEIYNIFYHLRGKLAKKKYDVIILMMDFPEVELYMKVLKMLFSKEAGLERPETQWLIPDITFGHRRGILEALDDVHVVQTMLTFIQHKPYLDCEMAGRGVEHRGQMFAVKTLKDALGNLTKDAFSMHNLWSTIKKQRRWRQHNSTYHVKLSVRDGTYPDDVTMSFVDHITTRNHTLCKYETTAVYLSPDNPESKGLGQGVGGLADSKIIQPHNRSALIYGLVPPDAELEAVLVEDRPFIGVSEGGEFEGIAIDVYHEVRKALMVDGIILNLNLRKVDFYGGKSGGTWNGVFGELANNEKSVLALGQISITQERKRDFAFTPPFGFIHRTYLISKQEKSDLYLQFARPFANVVWLALLLIVVASAVYIFILDRWNPFRDLVPRSNRFTGYESLWYSYLTMCHLSAPFAARNLPIQIFSIFYWFFSMIVVGSYTGNLASTLTDAYFLRPQVSSDLHALPQQSEFRFGSVAHTATSNEMKLIQGSTGESLYDIIERRGDFVENYTRGYERVKNEKYILIGTSGVMSHFRNTDPDCALELNSESYYDAPQTEIGFAMRKDWILKEEFSNALAYLMETGRIAAIYYRWQKQGVCELSSSQDTHARMSFKSLTGLFIMLAGGIALSYVFLAIKLIHLKMTGRKVPVEEGENGIELNEAERSDSRSSAGSKNIASEAKIDEAGAENAVDGAQCAEENELDNTSEYDNMNTVRKRS